MLKKILKIALKIVIFVLVYLLQIYVVNNTIFFGVSSDICLMFVTVTTLISKQVTSYVTATTCGIMSDLLFSNTSIKYVVIYILVTAVLIELKKMYRSDSKIAVIIFGITATVIAGVLLYIFTVMSNGELVNIFTYILNILKVSIVNVCLAYLLYIPLKMCE